VRALLLLLLLSGSAQAADYDLPGLPARAALSGGSGLCVSPELRSELAYRFLRVVDASQPHDITVECAADSKALVLKLYSVNGVGIAKFTIERSAGSADAHTAFIAANAVAKDADVIEAALDLYVERNADLADAGEQDLFGDDGAQASDHLERALESDLNAAPLYFGLYEASAEIGRPEQAKWYLEAFLKASRHKAEDLTDRQILPLIRAQASGSSGASLADGEFQEYQRLAQAHHWHSALQKLKDIIALAPWYEPAYVSLAQSYDRIGWKRLAPIWRARAKFARALNRDADLGRSVEERLDEIE
jgi:hypothetical protein